MKTAFDPRHRKREELVRQLFAASFHNKVPAKFKRSDHLIAAAAPEWPLDRLNPIDLAILRLAVFELVIDNTEPVKVIIDEAVELAKQFGGSTSPSFVNGVLGTICKSLPLSSNS